MGVPKSLPGFTVYVGGGGTAERLLFRPLGQELADLTGNNLITTKWVSMTMW